MLKPLTSFRKRKIDRAYRDIRIGILNARADIRTWGDNDGSKLFKSMVVMSLQDRLATLPVNIGRGYRETVVKFFKDGGNNGTR